MIPVIQTLLASLAVCFIANCYFQLKAYKSRHNSNYWARLSRCSDYGLRLSKILLILSVMIIIATHTLDYCRDVL